MGEGKHIQLTTHKKVYRPQLIGHVFATQAAFRMA